MIIMAFSTIRSINSPLSSKKIVAMNFLTDCVIINFWDAAPHHELQFCVFPIDIRYICFCIGNSILDPHLVLTLIILR